jgi:hypothetical protein
MNMIKVGAIGVGAVIVAEAIVFIAVYWYNNGFLYPAWPQ